MIDILINNVSLREYGLKVVKRPSIPTTKKRYETNNGTNGDVFTEIGTEDNVLNISFTLLDKNNLYESARQAYKVLSNAETLICSTDAQFYYKVKKVRCEDIEISFKQLGKFNVEFTIAPYAYNVAGKNKIIITENTTVTNIGNIESEPKITVYGTGNIDLVVGQQVIKLTGINEYITLDTPILEAYKGTELQNRKVNGEFPTLPEGTFSINYTGNVNRIEIIPNWRCL